MDATSSATVINNIILNLNFQVVLNLTIYAFFITVAVTSASKLIILLVQKICDIIYQRWLIRFQDKRNLALEVIKICTEGSTTGWNTKPRDMEHIYYIATLLEGQDEKASKLFDSCISNWALNVTRQEHVEATKKNIQFSKELRKEAQDARKELVKIMSKWR